MASAEGELVCFQAGEDRKHLTYMTQKTEKSCLLCKEPGVCVCSRILYAAHIPWDREPAKVLQPTQTPAPPRLVLYFTLIVPLFFSSPLPPSILGWGFCLLS